jgi:hypothetical protein
MSGTLPNRLLRLFTVTIASFRSSAAAGFGALVCRVDGARLVTIAGPTN